MNREIICTLGPATLNEHSIRRLTELGVSLVRINMSHTKLEDLAKNIRLIRACSKVPICIDTEGAQVRTGEVSGGRAELRENCLVEVSKRPVAGDERRLSFYPDVVFDQLVEGDIIHIDFDSVMGIIVRKGAESARMRILVGGMVGRNKAVTIERDIDLPPLTRKDRDALALGRREGILHVALSFVNHPRDIACARALSRKDCRFISKIETIDGVRNLDGILAGSDAILIDRGDLSRQVPIEKIAAVQKSILARARRAGRKAYVATNLLESMITSRTPTRAEVNDVFNTLCDGASGLVLAAETAIGKYPLGCVKMVRKIIAEHHAFSAKGASRLLPLGLLARSDYSLNEPNGGVLVDRVLRNYDHRELRRLPRLTVDKAALFDAEQISLGTFSPIEGFMGREELDRVLGEHRLLDGTVWPLPVVLQVGEERAAGIACGDRVALATPGSDDAYAVLDVQEVYRYPLERMVQRLYGTGDAGHPGVDLVRRRGEVFLGGKVELVKKVPSSVDSYELGPRDVRKLFEKKGWSKVVGFHTRNVAHRAHEHIQLHALEHNHCDGLFISPVSGMKKKGDYRDEVIFRSYEAIISRHYPPDKVVLCAFKTYSRFAGPREAVFTALCRKNFGCTHFIVGRDHTGVGGFYGKHDVRKLFEKLGDIGIEPVFYEPQHYCARCRAYVGRCGHGASHIREISGSSARDMIRSGTKPPEWFMRGEISQAILDTLRRGGEVFES